MSELGIKLEMGTTNPIDDERYSEISRLLYSRGGKRKIPFSKKKRKTKKKRNTRRKTKKKKKKKKRKTRRK